jgi:hypothetical protein
MASGMNGSQRGMFINVFGRMPQWNALSVKRTRRKATKLNKGGAMMKQVPVGCIIRCWGQS